MWQLFRRIARHLYIAAGIIAIVLAIGIGSFRLVATQLPSYRGDIQAWARDALGLEMYFESVDARWALYGPELTFYDVSVATPGDEAEPMFTAGEASIGISVQALLTERRFAVNRLTVVDTRLAVERTEDGSLRIQGAPANQATTTEFEIDDLPPVEVVVRDSTILYEDPRQGIAWEFLDVSVGLTREANRLLVETRADAPAELASRVDLSADGSLVALPGSAGREWRIVAEIRDLDLSALSTQFPDNPYVPRRGVGDVSFWLDFLDGDLQRATSEIEVADLLLADNGVIADDALLYETLSVTTEWSRDASGW